MQRARLWRGLIEGRPSRHDYMRPAFSFNPREQRESLGRDFRIRQDIFDRRKFNFR